MLVHHVEVQKIEDEYAAHYAAEAAAAKPTFTKVVAAFQNWFATLNIPAPQPAWSIA